MDKRKMTAIVGVLSVMTLGVLAGCGPKEGETDSTTTAPTGGAMSASPGAMSASPGAMGTPGAMATMAPPPGPK